MLLQVGGHIANKTPMWAIVDDEDYERVNAFKWCAKKDRKTTYVHKSGGVSLHRFIMGLETGDARVINHLDGNGLNNAKANLELSSALHNSQSIRQVNSTRNVGTVAHFPNSRGLKHWKGTIRINGKLYQQWTATQEEACAWLSLTIDFHFKPSV